MRTQARVLEGSVAARRDLHLRAKVWKMIHRSRTFDGKCAPCVEAEEEDSRLSSERDIRPDVELGKFGERRQGRQASEPQMAQVKRSYRDPRRALV
jgi:hypothetical protein